MVEPRRRREPSDADLTPEDSSGVHVSRRAMDGLRALGPEVEQLVEAHEGLQRRYEDLLTSAEALATLLDRVPWGLAVLRGRRLIASNAEARRLIETSVLHRALDGTLTSRDAEVRETLERSFHHVATRQAELASLSVPSSSRPLQMTVLPNQPPDGTLLVVFIDPDRSVSCSPNIYAQLYGLTAGESRVAQQLVMGRSPREAAEALGVGVETVRTHLKNALAKVGCHRQADLVRRLVTDAGALAR